jgi:4-nitrophenyl phosphatase
MKRTLNLQRYRTFLVDLDGVLVRGSRVISGAGDALTALRELAPIVVLSNNSTRSRRSFAEGLQKRGLLVKPEEIVNSAYVVARHLREIAGPSPVFALGEEGLVEELQLAGHEIAEPEDARFLVVGLDRALTYEKLAQALQALLRGARFLATNADPTYPAPQGLIPGAGAMVGAIRGMGYEPAAIVGKPSEIAFRVAMEAAGVFDPQKCLMIGDRLDTDIAGATRLGMDTALVLTGVTTPEDLERWTGPQPSWVAESLAELVRIGLSDSR